MTTSDRIPDLSTVTLLCVWLGVQVLAIFLAAHQVSFSAWRVVPTDATAPQVMLVLQISLGGMLVPFLHRHRAVLTCAVVSVFPFILLAGILAEREPVTLITSVLMVVVWLTGLGMLGRWSRSIEKLESPSTKTVDPAGWVAAGATLWSVGGSALWYLARDADAPAPHALFFGPIVTILHPTNLSAWLVMGAPTLLGLMVRLIKQRTKQVIHHSSTS